MSAALHELRGAVEHARARKSAAVREWSAADESGDTRAARAASQRIRYWERRTYEASNALHPVLTLDVESLPMLDGWAQPGAAGRYADTPTWEPRRGMSVHIGGGVFVTVCAECDRAVRHIGAVPRYATVGQHEVTDHGMQVPGINVGMLP